jgi:D-lactate dehydrogenase
MHGFGSKLLAHDVYHSPEAAALGVTYVDLPELLKSADVISLHCNLTPENTHMIDERAFASMKPGAVLINTARGGLVDTRAAINALKSGHLGALGIDVVEEESSVFFRYREREVPDALARLLLFNNVLVTGHQAFLTDEALTAIASVTASNVDAILDARDAGKSVAPGPTVVVSA